MKKLITLFSLLTFSIAVTFAATEYTVGAGSNENFSAGQVLSASGSPITVTLESGNPDIKKMYGSPQYPAPDYTNMSVFGSVAFNMDTRADKKGTRVQLKVSQSISNLRVYMTAASTESTRQLVLQENDTEIDRITCDQQPVKYTSDGSNYLFKATIESLAPGTYYISTDKFSGFLIGLKYELSEDQGRPGTNPGTGIAPVYEPTVWDFSQVSTTCQLTPSEYTRGSSFSYLYLLWQRKLKYKTTFAGDKISFGRQFEEESPYAIRDSKCTEGGFLVMFPGVKGAIRVTFTDTDSQDDVRKFLFIENCKDNVWESSTQSKYWVSNAEGQSSRTTELIPVEAEHWYYLRGIDEDGNGKNICFTRIEFIPMSQEETEGVSDDLFTQRVFSHDELGRSVSTWTYCGYRNGTHGLVGGVEDNGIIYKSSEELGYRDDNSNGNVKFSLDNNTSHSYTHFLSCSRGSWLYIPVPPNGKGTLNLSFTGTEKEQTNVKIDDGDATYTIERLPGRWFDVCNSNGQPKGKTDATRLHMLGAGSSYEFSTSDIVWLNGKSYILLKGWYEKDIEDKIRTETKLDKNKDYYKGELKVLSISVTLDQDKYDYTQPRDDYDHEIGGGHHHAIFNFTEGDITNSADHSSGRMRLASGARMTGYDWDDKQDSKTDVFSSFRGGDLVRYKNAYYGGVQMLSSTDYTITAPAGYYITTSVRVHGYNNTDKRTSSDSDEPLDTYVANFNKGVFEDNRSNLDDYTTSHDNTFLEHLRDTQGNPTTTLDFITTAVDNLTFSFGGYQFLGIVDAVYVRKENVPQMPDKLYYDYDWIHADMNDYEKLRAGGYINYYPKNENEELWWYFVPLNEEYGSRGCITRDNNTDYTDPNTYKTFSVRNYKFVNAKGYYEFKDLKATYDNESNYKPKAAVSTNSVNKPAKAAPNYDGPVSLYVEKPGTYYYYLKNTQTNLNSVLAIKTFDLTTGVEDITVSDEDETDELMTPVYNIYGQRVDSSYRGIVIRNGRKYVQR